MKSPNFNLISGYVAIGSIVIVSVMASIQAFINLRPFFDKLLKTAVWELFIAIPVLVLTYLVGLVFVNVCTLIFDKIKKETIHKKVFRLIIISRTNSEMIINRYEKLVQEVELLQAGSLAILCLAIGLILKIINATPDIGGTLVYGRFIFGGLVILLLFFVPILQYFAKIRYQELIIIINYLRLKQNKDNKLNTTHKNALDLEKTVVSETNEDYGL
jgi:hypothetical protein